MTNITNLVRVNEKIVSYDEDGETFEIARNALGKPTSIQSKRGKWVEENSVFRYDSKGRFLGLTGDIETTLLPTLLAEAGGTATFATDPATGNAVGLVDPVGGGPIYFGGVSYLWAARPAAAGNAGQVIRVSDVGTGLGGSHWVSDGTYWRPVGGSVVIAAQSGSIATPVSSFTGVTSSQFTPTKQPIFPAGMLIPGQSNIEVEAIFRRTGATATATLNASLGTAKNSGDSAIYAFTYPATTLAELIINPTVLISETGRFTSTNWQPKGGSSNTNVTNDKTGNVNTAAEMGVTFSISGANIADSFALIGYRVRLNQ